MAETYRSGRWKGLPKRCECGGKMLYERSFNRIWSACDTCTPEVSVAMPRVEHKEGPPGALEADLAVLRGMAEGPQVIARLTSRGRRVVYYCEMCRRGWMPGGPMWQHLRGGEHGMTHDEASEWIEYARDKARRDWIYDGRDGLNRRRGDET